MIKFLFIILFWLVITWIFVGFHVLLFAIHPIVFGLFLAFYTVPISLIGLFGDKTYA